MGAEKSMKLLSLEHLSFHNCLTVKRGGLKPPSGAVLGSLCMSVSPSLTRLLLNEKGLTGHDPSNCLTRPVN